MEIDSEIRRHLKDGNLAAALEDAKRLVRNDPAGVKPRILIFQLLSLNGEWDRAMTQLTVIGDMDATAIAMVSTYRALLRSEAVRARVFAGAEAPVVFGSPESWQALLIEALRRDGAGRHDEAAELRARAFDQAPATAGSLDGVDFSWIADGDQRLGPVLEAVVNGRYLWIPFSRLRAIAVDPPGDLRDLVWTPATLTVANGGKTVAFIPTRYPGTPDTGEAPLLLARRTEWREAAAGLATGVGQRMLVTDEGEYPLMDIQAAVLDGTDGAAEAAGGAVGGNDGGAVGGNDGGAVDG